MPKHLHYVFNGKKYYWDGHYWQSTSIKPKSRLHRDIWVYHNGKIEQGYEVHHKDHNRHNNQIDNLECLTVKEHRAKHRQDSINRSKSKKHQEHLDKIRPLTKAWHSSPEGKKWHSKHGKEVAANLPLLNKVCRNCGDSYVSKSPKSVYCGNNCKSAYRRKSGKDEISSRCEYCNKLYWVNKYKPTKYCSNKCSGKAKNK